MKRYFIHLISITALLIVLTFNACQNSGFGVKKTIIDSSESGGFDDDDPTHKGGIPYKNDDFAALASFPKGKDQLAILCARPGNDRVRKKLCDAAAPKITSLVELMHALDLDFSKYPLPKFALLGHSTSLVGKGVSALNPRAIIMSGTETDFVTLSFTRGEGLVEIIAHDPVTDKHNFFLVQTDFECTASNTCTYGDYLLPRAERGWVSVSIYEDEDLKNTIFDCRHCHQPGGPSTKKILRMHELDLPWTHWMVTGQNGGKALLADFHAAHDKTEDFAGIPAAFLDYTSPTAIQMLLKSFGDDLLQPNKFNAPTIEAEVVASSPQQPWNNSVPGTSNAWNAIFDNFVNGLAIGVPYHDVKITDATKLAAMTKSYIDVMTGVKPYSHLPDIRNVLPDDQTLLAEMSFAVKPGTPPAQALKVACAQCHNSKLDQSITRAKFNVENLTAASKQEAIKRLKLESSDPKVMPPARFRTLTPAQTQEMIQYLSN